MSLSCWLPLNEFIPHILSVRRILYWDTLLKRPKEELTSQIYYAMKENPLKGEVEWSLVRGIFQMKKLSLTN